MHTKLTLRLDSELIERAKAYASATGRSVSQLVSDYFQVLGEEVLAIDKEVPAAVRALHGCLGGVTVDEGDYLRHVEAWHRGLSG